MSPYVVRFWRMVISYRENKQHLSSFYLLIEYTLSSMREPFWAEVITSRKFAVVILLCIVATSCIRYMSRDEHDRAFDGCEARSAGEKYIHRVYVFSKNHGSVGSGRPNLSKILPFTRPFSGPPLIAIPSIFGNLMRHAFLLFCRSPVRLCQGPIFR